MKSHILCAALAAIAFVSCGGEDLAPPELSITLENNDCQPSCLEPRFELLVVRDLGDFTYCTLKQIVVDGASGSVVMRGAPVNEGDTVSLVVRVYCPDKSLDCPECVAEQEGFQLGSSSTVSFMLDEFYLDCKEPAGIPIRPPDCE